MPIAVKRSGETMTRMSGRQWNSSICGQTLRHCFASALSRPTMNSVKVPKAIMSSAKMGRAPTKSTARTCSASRSNQRRTPAVSSSPAGVMSAAPSVGGRIGIRDRGNSPACDQVHRAPLGEQCRDRRIAHVEPAGIGAERGQDDPPPIAHETASAQAARPPPKARLRMIVAAHFAGRALERGAVPEGEGADRNRFGDDGAADLAWRRRVVIAGDPDPLMSARKGGEPLALGVGEAACTLAIMEAVAETDHAARLMARERFLKNIQAGSAVVGRQQRARSGVARALLQMEIGKHERTLGRPIEAAARIGDEFGSIEPEGEHGGHGAAPVLTPFAPPAPVPFRNAPSERLCSPRYSAANFRPESDSELASLALSVISRPVRRACCRSTRQTSKVSEIARLPISANLPVSAM